MKKNIVIIFLLVIMCFCSTRVVLAEETTTKQNCDYKTRAELNKLAASITASYDIEKREDGKYIFKFTVYNVVENLFVSVTDETETLSLVVTPAHLTNGVYTFNIENDTDVIRYNFVVRSLLPNCSGDLKKFTVVKPKRNKYHDYNECKFTDTENYTYCQEWVTRDFSLNESEIIKKINEQRSINKKITTTKCVDCDEKTRDQARLSREKIIKKIIVIVVSILSALDIIYIYIKSCRIKDSEL